MCQQRRTGNLPQYHGLKTVSRPLNAQQRPRNPQNTAYFAHAAQNLSETGERMVGGTRFELVTPTMSILERPSTRTCTLSNFNALFTVKLEHCCSLVVGLWLSWL